MTKFKLSLLFGLISAILLSVSNFNVKCEDLRQNVLRLHIIANSDTESDQNLKLKVRDEVLQYTYTLFNNAKSKYEAENVISDNLQNISNVAYKTVLDNGFDYPVKAEITNMYFTTRYYENYTLPSGKFDALRITIGSGKGKNWWCVMYPSICISSVKEQDEKARDTFDEQQYDIIKNEQIQYKFKVVEVFEKICSFFS